MYVNIGAGCERITYTEIDSYQRITGEPVSPFEADLMIKIDQARREHGD